MAHNLQRNSDAGRRSDTLWRTGWPERIAVHVGDIWAYREQALSPDSPLVPVEILQFGPTPPNTKVRVRFLEGDYPGLDEWVPKVRLRMPWNDVDAWRQDEERFENAWQASVAAVGTTEHRAARLAVSHYDGISIGIDEHEGAIIEISDLEAVARDLGLGAEDLRHEPLSFVDRFGRYFGPWPVALRLAQRVAEVHADEMLAAVAREEQELQDGAVSGYYFELSRNEEMYVPPERAAERLREQQPAFDLLRAWCGQTAVERFDELTGLRGEVARLRGLVEEAAQQFEKAGEPRVARRLRKAVTSVSQDKAL